MEKYKSNIPLLIVLINTLISFLIDVYMGFSASWEFGAFIILIEIPIIYIILKTFDNKNWAFIIAMIYYFLRSFNYYSDDFTFYAKNGINLEFSLSDKIGVNLISLIMLILIIIAYNRVGKENKNDDKACFS